MSDHIYKKIEIVGSSPDGIEDAMNNAISRAGKTIRNMNWFERGEGYLYKAERSLLHQKWHNQPPSVPALRPSGY